ncbi:hypothetical protein LEP1GSC103_2859 [Leptospira borgpetersenii serovar Javanica str. UI 09931]|uniref:Uncharacterized protein n=1 Tax=Leptospira borgpetersenii serovar Javanica str. UI 09931 TaxID=1049767 RepID=A0AAV3JCN9_LEPBO|nr:hypothetical protein LEP1GSC101_3204 [Leptospira borgpetersenii str. UI 09149]EMN59609.1 hypothetical protein LEP1GSC090_1394 [Leptospira borgpetersenii serovar Javanica str. MK146]EPG58370.1 hypothetical protein LEP1GSC103_2859 [Leptospira borgpetersenii serovar Javanica str. UI 09931]
MYIFHEGFSLALNDFLNLKYLNISKFRVPIKRGISVPKI